MSRTIVVAAASAEAAMRLAQRADRPEDLGPATNPERAAAGWRRYAFPVTPPPGRAAEPPAEALLAKVRKLLALAGDAGASEQEAANAAAAAQRLIEQHRLDTALLDVDTALDADPPRHEPVESNADPVDRSKRLIRWKGVLLGGVTRANGCRHYWHAITSGGYELRVIGQPSRVAVVRPLYAWLVREVDRLGSEAAKGRGRSYGHAWRVGCASRLSERLREAARDGLKEARQKAEDRGVALVRVEAALAKIDPHEELARVDHWMKANLHLRSGGAARIRSGSGYADGQAAGDRIRLTGHAALGRGAAGRLGGGS